MDTHVITDFGYEPVDELLWVDLEATPSPAWWRAVRFRCDVEVGRPAYVVSDGPRLYLHAPALDEPDMLAVLRGLVDVANQADVPRHPTAS